jgi:hypothetical protein
MNSYRHRSGDPQHIEAAVDSATVIGIGDLLWLDTDDAKPAADKAWDTNIATTQEAFHDVFLGLALEQSRAGDTAPISVATGGLVEFDCAAATFELGALVGPAKQTGNAIESQKVVSVATANLAIGRVAKRYASNTTKVLVEIISTVMRGGPQTMM